jgi:anti-sigma B factor antagonist
MSLEIVNKPQERIDVLCLNGRLTLGAEDVLLREEIAKAITAGKTRIVMDMEGVDKMDSAGLGTLLFARAELRKAGGGLALANLHPTHMELLVITKLETVFEAFGTVQDAVNSFFPERKVPHYDLLELVKTMREARARS